MNSSFTILESGGYLDEGFWVELKDGSVVDAEEEEEQADLSVLSKARVGIWIFEIIFTSMFSERLRMLYSRMSR